MQPSRQPRTWPVTENSGVRSRSFALLCAALCVLSAHCIQSVGGVGGNGGPPAPPLADGAVCNNNVECASYSCGGNGVCVAPVGGLVEIDGLCNGGQQCVGDASCQDGLCVALGDGGACAADTTPCETDGDCCKGICTNHACGDGLSSSSSSSSSTTSSGSSCASAGSQCSLDRDCCGGSCDTSSYSCY